MTSPNTPTATLLPNSEHVLFRASTADANGNWRTVEVVVPVGADAEQVGVAFDTWDRLNAAFDARYGKPDTAAPATLDPRERVLTFTESRGQTLGDLWASNQGLIYWLAREARSADWRSYAQQIINEETQGVHAGASYDGKGDGTEGQPHATASTDGFF